MRGKSAWMRDQWLIKGAAVFCGLCHALPCAGMSQGLETATATPIEIDEIVGANQSAGQAAAYVLDAEAGQDYLIAVHQEGLDFVITVEAPDGAQRKYNSPLRRDEREFVLLENTLPGEYRIAVDSPELTKAKGRHEVRATRLAAGLSPDYVEAMRLMSSAAAAYATGERGYARQALDDYLKAAGIWHALGRERERAQSLYSVAMIEYWVLYNWVRCESFARQAAVIYQGLGERGLHANTVYLQGVARIEEANVLDPDDARNAFETALHLLQTAQETHRQLDNAFELARIRNDIGMTYYYRGEWERARTEWEQAAEAFADLSEWREELNARQNQAVVDGMQGNNARAIEVLTRIVDTLPAGTDPHFETAVLDNLAENHRLYGNYEEALRKHSAALQIHRHSGDVIGEVNSLRGIGNTYYSFGELALASQYLEQTLSLAKKANDGRSQQAVLSRLGDIAFQRAEYSEALRLHRAALDMAAADPDRAMRQVWVARDLASLNLHHEARVLAVEVSELAEASNSLATFADAQVQIGNTHIALGTPSAAAAHFETALTTYRSLGLRAGQADAAHGLALGARALGDLESALRHSSRALDYINSLRTQVTVPELRALYSAASRRYYETRINLLMESHEESGASQAPLETALATSEASRARMVINLLREASVGLRTRVDSDLLESQRELYEELGAKRQQRDRLLEKGLKGSNDREKLGDLLNTMSALERDLHLIEGELRRTSPVYARMSSTASLDANGLQALLDPESLLLQYMVGDERSYVFAVTADSTTAAELAGRETLQREIALAMDGLQQPAANASERRVLEQRLASVSKHVLAPVNERLAGKKRLLLALDGALQYIPFGVLPIEVDGEANALIETHEIVVVPSMSAVAAIRSRPDTVANESIAIFADPVIEESDPRLDGVRLQAAEVESAAVVPLTRSGGTRLSRLPYSGLEAMSIADLVPVNERHVAIGFAASRDHLMSLDLTDYRVLHFATHGLIDSRYSALSAIVLSGFDERGQARDGMLRLYDIFDLELNADLVVLSACNTALGRDIPGEGLVGLAQGFMYAGAKRLLLSLWQVSDRGTVEVMSRFYENLLERNLSPPQALRAAQVSLAAEPRWRDPYYWGAFVIHGDWL